MNGVTAAASQTDLAVQSQIRSAVNAMRPISHAPPQRSSGRYSAVPQSLGEPDRFRLRYRQPLREVVARVVRERLDQKQGSRFIDEWSQAHIPWLDRLRFAEVAENELIALHEANFALYKLRPSEFDAWRTVWERKDAKS